MTESNTDHFHALILALPQNPDARLRWYVNPHDIFRRHLRLHYPSRRPGRGGFEVYPGTREQQQFDFDFVHNCGIEGWHHHFGHCQLRWNEDTGTWPTMDDVLVYVTNARDGALKRTLELKHGVESVQKR